MNCDFCIHKILTFAGEKKNKKKLIMDKNVHLISKTGEKIAVPHKDYNDSEMLKDGKYDDYHIDVDWYLANGYSKAEDVFSRIESQAL